MNDRSVHISGGTVSGQIATGDHSVQHQTTPAPSDPTPLVEALDRLERLLAETDLPDADRARRNLRDVREEVTADHPDVERRDSALQRLAAIVAPITVLTEAVTAVRELLP